MVRVLNPRASSAFGSTLHPGALTSSGVAGPDGISVQRQDEREGHRPAAGDRIDQRRQPQKRHYKLGGLTYW